MQINPQTGLNEELHEYYRVPLVHQRNINALRLNGQRKAVHTVPLGSGLTLDFYSSFAAEDELLVLFHGANSERSHFYPRFERVQSIKTKTDAFISFADPMMRLGVEKDMLLSWYLGGPDIDPLLPIFKVIRRALGRTGSKHVAFIGGSGGGFAALRASAMWPGSLAYIQDPQTVLANYIPRVVAKYFETAWPGWSRPSLLNAFPERFDMARHYQNLQPANFVYYAQNSTDTSHVDGHYKPFLQAHGMSTDKGINSTGNRNFALYDGKVNGHGKITPEEFDFHFSEAMKFWRSSR